MAKKKNSGVSLPSDTGNKWTIGDGNQGTVSGTPTSASGASGSAASNPSWANLWTGDKQTMGSEKYLGNNLFRADQVLGYLTQNYPQYPDYYGDQLQAPPSLQASPYVANPDYQYTQGGNMAQLASAPAMERMMGGDYQSLQNALEQPGKINAQNAYNEGWQKLRSMATNNGLYGSSIAANQFNQGLQREYNDALTKNAATAAATRYGMQADELNNLNNLAMQGYGINASDVQNQRAYDLAQRGMDIDQNQFGYKAGVTNAETQRAYNDALNQTNYGNALSQQQFNNSNVVNANDYAWKKLLADQQYPLQVLQAIYGGIPGANTAIGNSNAVDIANQQGDAAGLAGLLSAGGTLLGGYLGSKSGSQAATDAAKGIWDTVKSWF